MCVQVCIVNVSLLVCVVLSVPSMNPFFGFVASPEGFTQKIQWKLQPLSNHLTNSSRTWTPTQYIMTVSAWKPQAKLPIAVNDILTRRSSGSSNYIYGPRLNTTPPLGSSSSSSSPSGGVELLSHGVLSPKISYFQPLVGPKVLRADLSLSISR
jgi:hypothetical protein